MQVFVECAAGSDRKNRYDERSLKLERSWILPAPYPYAYGFVPGTAAGAEDALDCYIIARAALAPGASYACEPACTLEFFEGDELDYKILCTLNGEDIMVTGEHVAAVKTFITEIFKGFPDVRVSFGKILDRAETMALIGRRSE